ncbi:MAG: permease [Pirellulaceae bacterium]|nr:MAG: permease [Pirellulaceae bacterium]
MSRIISFAVLLGIILVVGVLFYKVLFSFFVPLFLAAVVVVVFHPVHQWILLRTHGREKLAAGLTTLVATLVLLIPFPFAIYAAIQGLNLIRENDPQTMRLRIEHIRDELGLKMPAYYPEIELVEQEIELLIEQVNQLLWNEEDPRLQRSIERLRRRLHDLRAAVAAREATEWDDRFTQLESLLTLLQERATISEEAVPAQDSLDEDDMPEATVEDERLKRRYRNLTPSQLAVEFKGEFNQLRADLLGGGLMALARELANPSGEDIEHVLQGAIRFAQPRLMTITGATGAFIFKTVVGFIIIIVAAYFFFYDGPSMVQAVMRLNPLDDDYERELLTEFDRISRAVVLATLLSALAQGITAGVGYFVVGLDYWLLLTVMTALFAMVPFVGPAMVWVPVVLYVGLYDGRMTAAIGLALWGMLAVGSIDNVVKIYTLQGQSRLHPLLALLSVLGGVQALGPIGIVIGPMVVALLQTLLSILQRELLHFDAAFWPSNLRASQPSGGSGKPPARRRRRRRRRRADSRSTRSEEGGDAGTA